MNTSQWKTDSTCKGYITFKKAYMQEAMEAGRQKSAMRSPQELHRYFKIAIQNIRKACAKEGISFIEGMNKLEETRDYWWMNYYNSPHGLIRVLRNL